MAGLLDRANRVGSKARGTRSQFRLNSENIFPFKCAYPIRLTDIMDSNQVCQNGEVLPANGGAVRTRTIREYEQSIKELKKENFDLKLRLFMLEESCTKVSNKDDVSEADNSVSVMVELKFEVEALRNELSEKENLLQTALEQVQQYETELKDLQAKHFQSQEQIALMTELPSKDQYLAMKNEKESLEKEIQELKQLLDEKSNELQFARKEMEELGSKNTRLESKVKKSSQTIQGLVYKFKQETEILPKDVRSIIINCLEAAKAGNEQALILSLQDFRTVLSQMSSNKLSNAFELCYATNGTKDQHVKFLEEMLAKSQEKCKNFEKQIKVLENKSMDQSKVIEENKELKSELKDNMNVISELEQKTIQLQGELHNAIKKVKTAEDESRDEKDLLSKDASMMSNSLTQTELTQHSLMESKLSYSDENFVHSDNINELKEEICILKLSIDQKDKELSSMKEEISLLQAQLDEALHLKEVNFTHVAGDYNEEMANLHRQLIHSCLVNKELVKYLERLAVFMEQLLQQKHDTSSMENLTESTDFFSELSKCIDQSLQLSQNLTKHLTICESSRIFDAEDSSVSMQKDDGQISYGELSKLDFASQTTSYENIEGSVPKRLFVRESTRKDDYRLDKLYYLLKDKCSEISMILDDLGKIDAEKSEHLNEIFVDLNNIKTLLNNTLQDLVCLKEKSQELQSLRCERCIIIEFCFQLEKSLQKLRAYLSHDIQTSAEKILKNSLSAIIDLKNKLNDSLEDLFPNTDLINHYLTDIRDNYYEFKEIKDKNTHLENEIINLKDMLKNKESLFENLEKQKNELNNEIDIMKKRLDDEIEEKNSLSAVRDSSMQKISQLNEDNVFLKETIKNLELRSEHMDMICNELKNELKETKENLEKMTAKCIKYEAESENLSKINKDNLDLTNKIKNLELQASQANVLCDQLKIELKEKNEELEKITAKCVDYTANFEMLSKLNEEKLALENKIKILGSEVSKVNILNEQLKKELQSKNDELDKLISQYVEYETQMQKLSQINPEINVKTPSSIEEIIAKSNQYKQEIDALLKVKNTLIEKREKEKNKFSKEKETLMKHKEDLLVEKNNLLHQINLEKSNTKNLESENSQLNDKLIQSSHIISKLQEELNQLKHAKILIENDKDKYINLYNDLVKEMNYTKEKFHNLESLCAEYERKLENESEIQKNLTNQIKSLSEVNSALQKQVKENILEAEMKKNDIIRLNEKRLNRELQYNLIEDKEKTSIDAAFDIPDDQRESVASTFQNRSLDSLKTFDFGKLAILNPALNKTNKDIIENQAKQIKSLEGKLSIYESRLKFLEKDNQDLQDQLTLHLSDKNKIFKDVEDNSVLLDKIANLESQIKSKESFIDCLKNDLSKTSNELINKNKEIEELTNELEHYKNIFDKYSPESFLDSLSYPQAKCSPFKSNIKIMNDRKWDLIQEIFNIQKKIYSEKGLPLDDLENFHQRILTLHSLETLKDLTRWHSEPFLKSASLSNATQVIKQADINERDYIINLKIDIDFLEHLLVFMRCFCIPLRFESESYEHGSDSDNNYSAKFLYKKHLKFDDKEATTFPDINGSTEMQRKRSEDSILPIIKNKWDEIIRNMSHKLTYIEKIFKSMNLVGASHFLRNIDFEELRKNPSAKSHFLKIIEDVISLLEKMENVFQMNSALKLYMESPLFAYKFDISDRESVLSDETLAMSRSESLSPVTLDDALLPSLPAFSQTGSYLKSLHKEIKDNHLHSTLHSPPSKLEKSAEIIGSSADSVCQRSHYSSPDLGIESDPNHESSAPELVEKDFILKERKVSGCSTSGKEEKNILYESDHSKARKLSGQILSTCDTLRAISSLDDYELLKKELGEILVGIKSILTRTNNALHNIIKHASSSRKSLEYSTLKEIKNTSTAIEFYLNEAVRIVDNFIIESCPSAEEWKLLLQQNEELNEKLSKIQVSMRFREKEFNEANEKLKKAQLSKEDMEKKISKKLLKTKKVIKQAEQHLLQMQTNKCMPKFSS